MKNVLITGGGSGLGRKIGEYLYTKGYNIYVFDHNDRSKIDSGYLSKITNYYEIDLSDIEAFTELITAKEFPDINILINNVSLRIFKTFEDFTKQDIDNYINVNLRGNIILTKLISEKMFKNNFGRIINISSRAAFYGYSTGSLYCASKGFILRFSEALAKEFIKLGNNVTINIICPNALTNIDGIPQRKYEEKIGRIMSYIEEIISTGINGKCYNTFSIKEKIYFLLMAIKNLY